MGFAITLTELTEYDSPSITTANNSLGIVLLTINAMYTDLGDAMSRINKSH